jgi:hypothetical protein
MAFLLAGRGGALPPSVESRTVDSTGEDFVRFSRSNTFYGNPVGNDVVMQWRHAILDNVRADAFGDGEPAWFQAQDTNDQTWWYVEVTREDYRLVAPDEAEAMDLGSDDDEPINSHGLEDNCYYVTAAALANTTTNTLIGHTEVMQVRGGVALNEIVALFDDAGLNSNHVEYTTFNAAESGMATLAGSQDKRFGFGFDRSNGTAHMIVATYDATGRSCKYYDHQINADGRLDASQGNNFYVFPQ